MAGEGLDDIIGKSMGGGTATAGVGFLKNHAAALVGHLAGEAASGSRTADEVGGAFRRGEGEPAGEIEIILKDLGDSRAISAPEALDGDGGRLALANGDGGSLLGLKAADEKAKEKSSTLHSRSVIGKWRESLQPRIYSGL